MPDLQESVASLDIVGIVVVPEPGPDRQPQQRRWEFPKRMGYLIGVLIIRILLFRVLHISATEREFPKIRGYLILGSL